MALTTDNVNPAPAPNPDGRRKSDLLLIGHSFSGSFRMVAQLITMMLLVPVVIGQVGEEKYGIWTLAMAIAGVLGFLEFGLVQAANRFLASLDFRNHPERMREMACTAFWMTAGSGLAVLAVGLPFSEQIGALFGVPAEHQGEAGFIITVLIVHLAFSIPLRNFSAVLISQRFMARAHVNQGVVTFLYFGAAYLVLRLGYGLPGLALAYLGGMILEHSIYLLMSRSILPLASYRFKNINPELIPKIAEFALFAWLGQVATVVFMRASVLIVQLTSGLIATGAYGVANRLTVISSDLANQVIVAGGAKTAKLAARSPEEKQEAGWLTLSLARRSLLPSGILAAVAISLGDLFLKGWIGGEMADLASIPLAVMTLDVAAGAPVMAAANALAMSGDHRWTNLVSFAGVAAFIPLAFAGGRFSGPIGVASASLAITLLFNLPLFLRRLAKQMDLRGKFWWYLVYRPHVLPFFSTMAVGFILHLIVKANVAQGRMWLAAALASGFICASIYGFLFIFISAPPDEKEQLRRLISKVFQKVKP